MRQDDRNRMTVLYHMLRQCDHRAFIQANENGTARLLLDRSLVDRLASSVFKDVHVDLYLNERADGTWITACYNGNTLMIPLETPAKTAWEMGRGVGREAGTPWDASSSAHNRLDTGQTPDPIAAHIGAAP